MNDKLEEIEQRRQKERNSILCELDVLIQKISDGWVSEKMGLEILEEMREDQSRNRSMQQ